LIHFELPLYLLNVAAGLVLKLLYLPLHAPLGGLHALLKLALERRHLFPNQKADQEKRNGRSGNAKEDRRTPTYLRSKQGASQGGSDKR
jgi:hypothetical protein